MNTDSIVKGKLVCVALNDAEQLAALQQTFSEPPHKAAPTQPVLYFKPRNTWSTDGATVEWAQGAEDMVVGASLAVVIGEQCCRVNQAQALDYVAGYSLMHDFSLPEKSYYRPDIKGKCLDGSAPVSAKLTPASQVADLAQLSVVTQINGETVSEFPLSQCERSVPELISTISYIMTLEPGDVIAVGFKGERSPVAKGANVTSAIAGVAELTNTMGGE